MFSEDTISKLEGSCGSKTAKHLGVKILYASVPCDGYYNKWFDPKTAAQRITFLCDNTINSHALLK